MHDPQHWNKKTVSFTLKVASMGNIEPRGT